MSDTKRIEIIPAIDLIEGRCVRLTRGDYSQRTIYSDRPADVARRYADIGIRRLHLVDLDGAKASKPVNLGVLEEIVSATGFDVQYGGGIKSAGALRSVFDSGAHRAICGSVAVTSPSLLSEWLGEWGSDRIILGADVKDGSVATHGWMQSSGIGINDIIDRFIPFGLRQVICTDISKDGMLSGPSFELYESLQQRYPQMEITVSGGIASMDDIRRLDQSGLCNVIVGKAIYEGRIGLTDLEEWLRNA